MTDSVKDLSEDNKSVSFLLRQVYSAHNKEVNAIKEEVKNLKSQVSNLRSKLKETKTQSKLVVEKKHVHTQWDEKDLCSNNPNPSKSSCLPASKSPKKIGIPEQLKSKIIEDWLETVETTQSQVYDIVLAPETVQVIPETVLPDMECYTAKTTHHPDILNAKKQTSPTKNTKKQTSPAKKTKTFPNIESIKTTAKPSTQVRIKEENETKISKKKTSPKKSRLSRRKRSPPKPLALTQSNPQLRTPPPQKKISSQNEISNINLPSPNIFSSPEVLRVIKNKVNDSWDPDETMLPEELAERQRKQIKLEKETQHTCSESESVDSQELLRALAAQKSPVRRSIKPVVHDSFDVVEQPKENEKYNEGPVRKQSERQKLNGYECQDCAKYFAAMNLSEEEKQKRLKICSRHRSNHPPPKDTVEFFWECGFPSTQELKARGYAKETQVVVEFKNRRKRPLVMLNRDKKEPN